jgi:hypothetical protein
MFKAIEEGRELEEAILGREAPKVLLLTVDAVSPRAGQRLVQRIIGL